VERASEPLVDWESGTSPDASHQPPSDHRALAWTSPIYPVLKRARFLQGLSNSERIAVLRAATPCTYSTDSVVAQQGDPADRLFLLVKGSARYFFITTAGQKVNLFWLVPGEIFGGACLLPELTPFVVSTEVTRESLVLVWQRDAIRTLSTRYHRLLENGLSIFYDYLVWYVATHLSLTCHSARERLAHVLASLSRGIGKKSANGVTLEITNEQLANTANITPFTASRLLNEWQRDGSILKRRGQVVLLHPEQLFRETDKSKHY
jgi:CRP-like cAMP-binding protein